jgi:hypothetical protein
MIGRPSLYTTEIADEICERLAEGESLNAICRDDHMPTRQAVHEWIADNRAGFGDKYARAKEVQLERFAEEIIDIADAVAGETESAAVQAAKLRVDSRKWVAARLMPKKYGDTVRHAHGGDDTAPPIQVDATLTPAEAYRRMKDGN